MLLLIRDIICAIDTRRPYWRINLNSMPMERTPKPAGTGWVYVMFFFSGFPALIYQIIWQRALFGIYGVNIESVTVVVSAFMLGLGVGSLLGGFVSERSNIPLLAVFGAAEIGIA